jgi:hypothetical protein
VECLLSTPTGELLDKYTSGWLFLPFWVAGVSNATSGLMAAIDAYEAPISDEPFLLTPTCSFSSSRRCRIHRDGKSSTGIRIRA